VKSVIVSHGIGKDHGGNLVNQHGLSFFDKCWKTTVGKQI